MACHFYILQSTHLGKFYIGHTCEELEERIRKHLSDHSGFTSRAKDWRLVYSEEYPDKSSAYLRERTVKSWKSRKKLIALIKADK